MFVYISALLDICSIPTVYQEWVIYCESNNFSINAYGINNKFHVIILFKCNNTI